MVDGELDLGRGAGSGHSADRTRVYPRDPHGRPIVHVDAVVDERIQREAVHERQALVERVVGDGCGPWAGSRSGETRSHDPELSPSVSPEAKFRAHRPATLQANWAGATVRRMAPRPRNAELPNVARSFDPSALNVCVEAGSRASASTAADVL